MIRMTAPVTVTQAAADSTPTISGIAVPWNVDAIVSDGSMVRFAAGSLPTDGPAPKLIESHDLAQVRGIVSERRNTETGMEFTAKIARTAAGMDAIELLKMGALDSVSVGVNPTKWSYEGDTMVVEAGEWIELSLVAVPAFSEARITQVAAQKPDDQTPPTTQEATTVDNTPQVVEAAAPAIIPTNPFHTEPAQPRRQFRLPTPGEWIAAWRAGGSDFAQLNANVMAAAPMSPLQAAAGDVTTAEADGILPTPIVGPIFDSLNQGRPVVTALGTRAMPASGKVFIRPIIKVRTDVGAQANELGALNTRSFETDDIQITKATFGGRVLLSEQVIDWSEPSMLDAVLNDLAQEYAVATEKRVVTPQGVIASAMSLAQGEQATNFTAADKFIEAMYSAAGKIAADTGYLPNVLACHPLMWTKIGQLTDNDKRPLFPTLAPSNAPGTATANAYTSNVLGLTLVVSKEMAGASFYGSKNANEVFVMFNSRNIELYEQQKGAVSVQVPDKLALNLAFRGYFQGVVLEPLGFKVIYTGTL